MSQEAVGLWPLEYMNVLFETGPNCGDNTDRRLFEESLPSARIMPKDLEPEKYQLQALQDLDAGHIDFRDVDSSPMLEVDDYPFGVEGRIWLPVTATCGLLKLLARKCEMNVDDSEVHAASSGIRIIASAIHTPTLRIILDSWVQNGEGILIKHVWSR